MQLFYCVEMIFTISARVSVGADSWDEIYGFEDVLGEGSDLLSGHHQTMMLKSTNPDLDER